MREDELLGHIYQRSAALRTEFPQVIVGPGDDCAVVGVGAGLASRVLLKTDQLIEGRHFVPGTPLDLVARKAIARAVSDIAAMAGRPVATLAACALPRGFEQGRANELFEACARWAEVFGAPLVGGDIASFSGEGAALTLTITSIGEPHAVRGPVLRSGARAGDAVYVTGVVGGSFERATGMGRHLTFEPRVAEAAWLADTLGERLHAMMDTSDGLGIDAGRLAAASGVEMELDAGVIPSSGDVERAIADGEDYELLFTVDPACVLPRECPVTGTPITRIGVCGPGAGAYLRLGGSRVEVSRRGWEHT